MSQTNNVMFSFIDHISVVCGSILDVLYSFATLNLIRKTFLLVSGVKIPVSMEGVFTLSYFREFLA